VRRRGAARTCTSCCEVYDGGKVCRGAKAWHGTHLHLVLRAVVTEERTRVTPHVHPHKQRAVVDGARALDRPVQGGGGDGDRGGG
jgi:hypothetical protein